MQRREHDALLDERPHRVERSQRSPEDQLPWMLLEVRCDVSQVPRPGSGNGHECDSEQREADDRRPAGGEALESEGNERAVVKRNHSESWCGFSDQLPGSSSRGKLDYRSTKGS